MLRIEPKASPMLGKHFTPELHELSTQFFKFCRCKQIFRWGYKARDCFASWNNIRRIFEMKNRDQHRHTGEKVIEKCPGVVVDLQRVPEESSQEIIVTNL